MFYNKSVEIWSKGDEVNLGGGVFIDGEPSLLKITKVDLQPYSSAEAKLDYGLDIITTHAMFTKEEDLKIGDNFIKYNQEDYHIKELITWDSYTEVLLELVK